MSREAELYKDKIEVSLDGRQIFYLFFGGAVIVGLVFVLGVMVGRRVEARGHTDRARVAATVDPLAALDRLEGGNGLSFQGALRGGDSPVSDVEKAIAQKGLGPHAGLGPQASGLGGASGVGPKKDELKKDELKKDELKKDELKKDELKKDELKKDEPKKDEPKKDEPKKDELKKAEAKVDTKTEAKRTDAKVEKTEAKKDEPKVEAKKTDAKVEKTEAKKDTKADAEKMAEKATEKKKDDAKAEASAEKTTEKKKDETKKEPHYTLQLSSFQDKAEAQAYLESMKKAGYSPYVAEGTVDGKQYFRVRIGSYKSMEAANDAKAELEKATKKSALVMKL